MTRRTGEGMEEREGIPAVGPRLIKGGRDRGTGGEAQTGRGIMARAGKPGENAPRRTEATVRSGGNRGRRHLWRERPGAIVIDAAAAAVERGKGGERDEEARGRRRVSCLPSRVGQVGVVPMRRAALGRASPIGGEDTVPASRGRRRRERRERPPAQRGNEQRGGGQEEDTAPN